MVQRKSGKSGRNLISLFLDEYARHTGELLASEEAHLALLNEIIDVRMRECALLSLQLTFLFT